MSFEKVPNFLLNFFSADMNGTETPSYRFNSFLLHVAERQLFRADQAIPLTPKAFDVLAYLVSRGGHLVLKDELMQAIWPDSFVDEVNLPRTIHTLRKALAEDENGSKFIETVPTKGYRFVAKVEEVSGETASPPPSGPATVLASVETGTLPSGDAAIAAATSEPRPTAKPESQPRSRSRAVLIIMVVFVLAASVTGFWFANRFRSANGGVNGETRQTKNGVAYQHFQQGRVLLERGRGGDLQKALASFTKAIELDPNYASAYAGKADAKMRIFWGSGSHDDINQARTAIDKAIQLDGANSYAHTLQCRLKATYDWDFKGAEKECGQAIDLDPNDPLAHREMAFFRSTFGRENEAIREIDAAVALAPTSFNKVSRGAILYYSRRYDEAIDQLRQVEETDPNEFETRRWLMNAYEMKKDYAQALETRIRQLQFAEATPEEIAALRKVYAESGWPGVLRSLGDSTRPTFAGAANFAQLGDRDRAFDALESILDRRAIMLIHLAREPRFDPIRSDPRFELLLKRIGLK